MTFFYMSAVQKRGKRKKERKKGKKGGVGTVDFDHPLPGGGKGRKKGRRRLVLFTHNSWGTTFHYFSRGRGGGKKGGREEA